VQEPRWYLIQKAMRAKIQAPVVAATASGDLLRCWIAAVRKAERDVDSFAFRLSRHGPFPMPVAISRHPARASFTCFAGVKPSFRDAAISIVSPVPGLRP
jgi:hypothetical protein